MAELFSAYPTFGAMPDRGIGRHQFQHWAVCTAFFGYFAVNYTRFSDVRVHAGGTRSDQPLGEVGSAVASRWQSLAVHSKPAGPVDERPHHLPLPPPEAVRRQNRETSVLRSHANWKLLAGSYATETPAGEAGAPSTRDRTTAGTRRTKRSKIRWP